MNQSLIIGRIVNDPELKETEKGKVSNITLAVQRPFKNANGEYETDFFPGMALLKLHLNIVVRAI